MPIDELISSEKQKYEKIWGTVPSYRSLSPAEMFTPVFLSVFRAQIKKGDRLIDFGCGTGRSAKVFLSAGLSVDLIDFSANCLDEEIVLLTRLHPEVCRFWRECLWDLPEELLAGEWGMCCDVLEHIPKEKVHAVLESMARRISKGAVFSISLVEDEFGPTIGQPLHLTLESHEWWKTSLEKHFPIVDLLLKTEIYVVFRVEAIVIL